ncbi:PLD nuclease N-terminal domain-containing protein [Kocuria rosea]|uniref:PLD nuclease N-terminal domain-containing protein n=1 Tax=Kocuria rosea TaxID=1275 RepID=UPI00254022AF|nr:PLD nuclease N-terminal domain-containing protein [Kocuria rosea]WIG17772.1 PLD nuclease N-terminal domain-containing protein [Kocuria rosea]
MNFWEFLWLLVIWTPLALLWGVALVDITRREDIGGGTKVLWALVIVLLPFVGPLVYLLTRSVGAAEEQRLAAARARTGRPPAARPQRRRRRPVAVRRTVRRTTPRAGRRRGRSEAAPYRRRRPGRLRG